MPHNRVLYQKTSNHVNLVLYPINAIRSARSPCLTTVYYIKRLLITLIWYYTQLTAIRSARSPCLATVCYIKRLLITLIWYYTQLTAIRSARSPCLATVYYIKRLLITLIWYYCIPVDVYLLYQINWIRPWIVSLCFNLGSMSIRAGCLGAKSNIMLHDRVDNAR